MPREASDPQKIKYKDLTDTRSLTGYIQKADIMWLIRKLGQFLKWKSFLKQATRMLHVPNAKIFTLAVRREILNPTAEGLADADASSQTPGKQALVWFLSSILTLSLYIECLLL